MRRAIHLRMVALLAVPAAVLAPLACTGETSFVIPPVDAGPVSTRYEAGCTAWATAVCDREERCPWYSDFQWASHDECLERSALICEVVAGDPNVVFDEQQMLACQYPTDCTVLVRDLPIDCLPRGRSPAGATCVFHEACESGECIDQDGRPSPCGTCLNARPSCVGGCPPNSVCTGGSADGGALCQPIQPIGGRCMSGGDCEFYCSLQSDAGDFSGVCVPLATLGDACGDGVLAGDPSGRVGPACAGTNLTCDATNHCTAMPPAPDGEVCDDSQGLGCIPPAECIGNRCLYPSLAYCAP